MQSAVTAGARVDIGGIARCGSESSKSDDKGLARLVSFLSPIMHALMLAISSHTLLALPTFLVSCRDKLTKWTYAYTTMGVRRLGKGTELGRGDHDHESMRNG